MEICIIGLNEKKYRYQLEHLAWIFFDNAAIFFIERTNPDLTFHITVNESETTVSAEGMLTDKKKEKLYEKVRFDKRSVGQTDKRAVNYVYLKLLQTYTGVVQPWGTLTGIRPTKLFHQMRKKGWTREEIFSALKDVFLVTEEKIALLDRIVRRQLTVLPDLYSLHNEVSIYIGIPFCPTKCAYCTFPAYAIGGQKNVVMQFLEHLHAEIDAIGKWLTENHIPVTTIYIGGGTPTSISAQEMEALYKKLHEALPNINNVREITVEAGRPDTITEEKLAVLKKWNIGRISVNPQSFHNETLRAIGRHHTVEETIEKFLLARKFGMDNINMDLIIGLPNEGTKELAHTLKQVEKLLPESLTVHTLSFKRASSMTKEREKYQVADRNEIAKMMEMASRWTKKHGYEPYYLYRQKNILGNLENVGYARERKESLYNILIMEEAQTIIGLGCGSSSKFVHPKTGKITHFANAKDPLMYIERSEHYTKEKIKLLAEIFAPSRSKTAP